MENKKTSKKALRGLINDSMEEALTNLELPKPGKKVKKLLQRNSKKLAEIFANVIKREDKKKKKAGKFMEDSGKRKSKKKGIKEVKVEHHHKLEAV
jgi:hypothetical protein